MKTPPFKEKSDVAFHAQKLSPNSAISTIPCKTVADQFPLMPKPRRKAFSNASRSKWFAQQLVDAKRPRCPNQASCNSNTHFVWLMCCVWLFQNHNVLIWNDWFKIRLPVFIFVGLPLVSAQNKNHGKCLWIFQYHFRISEFLEHANCGGWKQAVAQPDPQIFFSIFWIETGQHL